MLSGAKIAAARKLKGWSQSRLAEAVGVSAEAVSKWEREVYAPDDEKARRLETCLQLWTLDDEGTPLRGRLFDEVHMSGFLKGRLGAGDFPNALKALAFAKEKHFGQFRKPPELAIPYINHPLTMACHALAMGLEDDTLLAAILLHDVCEDCGVLPEELPVSKEAREIVALLTKPREGYSEQDYYAEILKNPAACLIKCIDRCSNVSGMALGFSPEKIREYVEETETWYPALLKRIKAEPGYNNAAFLLTYQLRSLLQTAKRIR